MRAIFERGLERCRGGNWKDGLVDLAWLSESGQRGAMPSLGYSYLGYGLAKHRGRVRDGVKLCQYAVKLEFFQTENYLNLARAALLSPDYRREAAEAVLEGLEVDPEDPELLELQKALGVRQKPVLRFLSRRNLINRILGWFRHSLRGLSRALRPKAKCGPPKLPPSDFGELVP